MNAFWTALASLFAASCVLVVAAPNANAAPLDTVLAALAAETATPAERVRLYIEHGAVAQVAVARRGFAAAFDGRAVSQRPDTSS